MPAQRPFNCKIFRHLPRPDDWDRSRPPVEIDYETQLTPSLVTIVTADQYGRNVSREFYTSVDEGTGTPSDLVVFETWTWTLSAVGDPIKVDILIDYINEDESINSFSSGRITYFVNEKSTAPERAERVRLVEQSKSDFMRIGQELGQDPSVAREKGLEWTSAFLIEIVKWEQIYSNDLAIAINSDTTLNWLNAEWPAGSGVTLRERLVTRFTPPPGTV